LALSGADPVRHTRIAIGDQKAKDVKTDLRRTTGKTKEKTK
jgi:hypothetical protein